MDTETKFPFEVILVDPITDPPRRQVVSAHCSERAAEIKAKSLRDHYRTIRPEFRAFVKPTPNPQ